MGWASTGFDSVDEAEEKFPGGGGGGKTFGFWTPVGDTKRIVFLDDVPFCFWQHSLYAITKKAGDDEICLHRNGINPDQCALCDVSDEIKSWPSFVGHLTVIDCGSVKYNNGEVSLQGYKGKNSVYQYDKKVIALKKGGKDKPGLLLKVRRYRDMRGGLTGTVWDLHRAGKKEERAGTDWTYVGKIDVSDPEKMLEALVAMDGSPLTSIDDKLLEGLDNEPVNYAEEFVPKTPQEIAKIVGKNKSYQPAPTGQQNMDSNFQGDQDDDVPF